MAIVDRSASSALIPEDVAAQIIQEAPAQSAALQLFRRVRMSRKQQRMPVLAALPSAGFLTAVGGDTDIGFKPMTAARWANRYLNAEPLGAIVAIPEDVLDDSEFDMWGEIRPRLVEAIGKAIDAAVFFGSGKPSTWPDDIVGQATTAGNVYGVGDSTVDLAEDINQTMALVERYGFAVTGHAAAPTLKARLRGLRDDNGQPIYVSSLRGDGGQDFSVYGYPTFFFKNGAWDPSAATLITGDYSEGIIALRQDISFKILTESTLYGTGLSDPLYALAQQDMVALRVVCRVAFQTAEPLTALSGTGYSATGGSTTGVPFAVLTP
jgi:HK97 family phage major capsid protein